MRIAITSGYFDPMHRGHLELLELSRAQGDVLWVIVNTDAQAALKKGKAFIDQDTRLSGGGKLINDDLRVFYARVDADQTAYIGYRPIVLRGNVGVQYIHTDQRSDGVAITPAGPAAVRGVGASYGDILPSLNRGADFGNGWNVRFGAAREMMRARINDMGARASVYVQTSQGGPSEWRGSGGNPEPAFETVP